MFSIELPPCCPKALWPGVEPNAGGAPNTDELAGGWPKTGAVLCPTAPPPNSDWPCCWGWACAENIPPAAPTPAPGLAPKTDGPGAAAALPPPKMEDPGATAPAEEPAELPPNKDVPPKADGGAAAFPPNIPVDPGGDVAAAACVVFQKCREISRRQFPRESLLSWTKRLARF